MEQSLQKAKLLLRSEEYTCVFLLQNGAPFCYKERGIKPLLAALNADMDTTNAVVADKVVGKAAAFLYALMKIKALFVITVSEPALAVLNSAGILVEYENLVPAIRNRDNTGGCPMESAVWDVESAEEARKVLEGKVKRMGI